MGKGKAAGFHSCADGFAVCRAAPCVIRHEHGAADCQQSQRTARMFTNAVISGGRNVSVPGSQSKLVTTLRASKDANFGVATRHWYDSD